MVAVAVVGVARLFDLVLRPDWSWLVLLVLAIGFAIWQLRRRQLTAASSTVWLDHHLGLGGLAMAELETDASAWRGELQERLRVAEPSRPLPRLRPGAVVVRVLGAAALIGGLWWLPAPSRAAARQQPLLAEALSRLEDQLDLFVEHSMLDAERQVEMQARLDRLREDLETGADVGWNDLDDLAATLDHERALAGESAEKTRAQAAQLARADAIAADPAGAAEQLAAALSDLAARGDLDTLPADLLAKLNLDAAALQAAAGAAGLDASRLPTDPELLSLLAKALADGAGQTLEGWAQAGLVAPGELQELAEVLARFDPAAEHVHTSECAAGGT
jgi:hypothetical protein